MADRERAAADVRAERRRAGTGLMPLRAGASVNLDGVVHAARPLVEMPEGAGCKLTCLWCDRTFADADALRAAHVDVHGMRARAEQHVYAMVGAVGVFTEGAP
ncbi:MAG TPA: hypothetical protein VH062_07610 [Polyangiaceae bacterium]|nr:hypothetical protein [Polyangiaceae bacterium]